MGLTREKIEHFIGDYYQKEHSGYRKWLKRQMNKWIRLNPDKLGNKFKRAYKGWEY